MADPTDEPAGTVTINTRQRKLIIRSATARRSNIPSPWARPASPGRARPPRAQGVLAGLDAAQGNAGAPPRIARTHGRRPNNPLGARALYLFQGKTDTLFRIHGTNEPKIIGHAASSGCIRMQNADVINLYGRVTVGAKVVVM